MHWLNHRDTEAQRRTRKGDDEVKRCIIGADTPLTLFAFSFLSLCLCVSVVQARPWYNNPHDPRRPPRSVPAAVREWFRTTLGEPTPPQRLGWPSIAAGKHTLILAPTGSGKTLAAFLACLDRLWRQPPSRRGVRVLYISPLKALNNDIHRNLQVPLEGVAEIGRAAWASRCRISDRRAHRRHARRRAATADPPAAARPHHHAGIAASAADLAGPGDAAARHARASSMRFTHSVPTNAASSCALLLERLEALQQRRPGVRAHRPVGDAAAAGGGGPLSRRRLDADGNLAPRPVDDRRRRPAQGPRSARRQSRSSSSARCRRSRSGRRSIACWPTRSARIARPSSSPTIAGRSNGSRRSSTRSESSRWPAPTTAASRWRSGSRPRRR